MFISMAHAQDVAQAITAETAAMADAPSAAGAFAWNMGMILVLVIMFYLLLIRPQQKRFQAHKEMVGAMKKGDKISTAGGLIGKVDKIIDDKEVMIDLGNDIKVKALRHTLTDLELEKQNDMVVKAQDDKKKADKKKTDKADKK